jgi:hypothetical protein
MIDMIEPTAFCSPASVNAFVHENRVGIFLRPALISHPSDNELPFSVSINHSATILLENQPHQASH